MRHEENAFTTLELTVVLTIMGVFFALAAPRFAALRNRSAVRSAMSDLGASFSYARQAALSRRAAVAVVLDTAAGVVALRSAGVSLQRHGLRSTYGVTISANRDSAVYDPRGVGYGVSNLTVTLRRGSFVDTLTVSRLGRTRW
jgi:type IV fimbrial biogenesis protein FimU